MIEAAGTVVSGGVDASAPILLNLLQVLLNKFQDEQTAAREASSGSNAPSSGVINSYGQVLTQDTKVR